jgi:hypothetical protein
MQQYFPPGTPDWYAKYLVALQEPSLWELSRKDTNAEVYRFLWLRSFDNPIAVRLIVTSDGGRLLSKTTSGKGGFEPGHLLLNRESRLSREATEWFLTEVRHARFWDVPTKNNSRDGLDGAEWIVEGVKQGRYHIIDRFSPYDPKDPAHVLGIALLINLARFRLLYQEVY